MVQCLMILQRLNTVQPKRKRIEKLQLQITKTIALAPYNQVKEEWED